MHVNPITYDCTHYNIYSFIVIVISLLRLAKIVKFLSLLTPTFRTDSQMLGRLHDTKGSHSLYVALHKCQ